MNRKRPDASEEQEVQALVFEGALAHPLMGLEQEAVDLRSVWAHIFDQLLAQSKPKFRQALQQPNASDSERLTALLKQWLGEQEALNDAGSEFPIELGEGVRLTIQVKASDPVENGDAKTKVHSAVPMPRQTVLIVQEYLAQFTLQYQEEIQDWAVVKVEQDLSWMQAWFSDNDDIRDRIAPLIKEQNNNGREAIARKALVLQTYSKTAEIQEQKWELGGSDEGLQQSEKEGVLSWAAHQRAKGEPLHLIALTEELNYQQWPILKSEPERAQHGVLANAVHVLRVKADGIEIRERCNQTILTLDLWAKAREVSTKEQEKMAQKKWGIDGNGEIKKSPTEQECMLANALNRVLQSHDGVVLIEQQGQWQCVVSATPWSQEMINYCKALSEGKILRQTLNQTNSNEGASQENRRSQPKIKL